MKTVQKEFGGRPLNFVGVVNAEDRDAPSHIMK
jgi:hypothetical protein